VNRTTLNEKGNALVVLMKTQSAHALAVPGNKIEEFDDIGLRGSRPAKQDMGSYRQ
jgi:hypothetical protein